MRRRRILAATAAIGLSVAALATATSASTASSGQSAASTASTAKTSYVVLADEGASAKALAAKLRASGVTVTSVNEAIGLVTVTSTKAAGTRARNDARSTRSASKGASTSVRRAASADTKAAKSAADKVGQDK